MTAFQILSLMETLWCERHKIVLICFSCSPPVISCPFHVSSSDVIELSSGDDDALQISSDSDDEDKDDRSGSPGADESSGAHVNDAHNQPDAQGRVLVNMNHPPEEEDLFLAPQLARAVKPHQVALTLLALTQGALMSTVVCFKTVYGHVAYVQHPNCIRLIKHAITACICSITLL